MGFHYPMPRHAVAVGVLVVSTALAWASTVDGGQQLYRSDDRRVRWTLIGAGLPGDIALTGIVSSPADPAHWFAGTGGRGVFHSRDRGATWAPLR